MTGAAPVLVFDSGVGGLSVVRRIRALLPSLPIVYAADDVAFPYGDLAEPVLVERCRSLIGDLVAAHDPRAVVIACNTASTLVLSPLRAALTIPVVGTVPAIKPAAQVTRTGLVSVLATPGTVKRDYTFDLIRRFAPDTAITLVGARHLAGLAERFLAGEPLDEAALLREIAPCFVEKDGARTDVVVLACTHFPLLEDALRRIAPWPVTWLDPAPAIARRLAEVLGEEGACGPASADGTPVDLALASSGRDLTWLTARFSDR
ncbi:glutamate racemase [Stappia taiwanensis]|uniref:Glutamate racemase n=1 Tax=Stappia taiwanensis TaxID=992267 RepID=A0A838XNA4_9HYPH|nr:glutamate racemase [Stappia taiwanensis]MBA4610491.1 glutamate racemase [Stappia taiwanensis]GGE84467.1 glutamate racemase [Stappia taiwanensis]